MVGPPKNKLHLIDPGILQLPIFRGLLYLQPFINTGGNSVMDLVLTNGLQVRNSSTDVTWGYNEYGPTMVNNEGWVVTNVPSNKITMDSFTLLSWASTESTETTRELLGGFYDNADLYIRFGRNANQPAIIVKTAGYAISTAAAAGHNDGLVHMFGATSSSDALKMYYEGKEIASETAIDGASGTTEEFWIGNTDEDYGWIGDISLAAAWNRPLSPAEMDLIYRMGPSLALLQDNFPIEFRGAVAAGAPPFNAAWAYNSNQGTL